MISVVGHRPSHFAPLLLRSHTFHTGSVFWSSTTKSPLAKLRKKTGYSLSLCRQALEKHEQDVARAEAWLKEQALEQGWAKAQKLQGRNARQGLVGVLVSNNAASMVELNCETDFVARNQQFHELLNQISAANLAVATSEAEKLTSGKDVHVASASSDQLSQLLDKKGRPLSDLIALYIGQIGENIVLRRGARLSAAEGVELAGVTHPSASVHKSNEVQYGKYGVVLGYTKDKSKGTIPEGQTTATMARQFCQHIIGMNPSRVGDISSLPPPRTENEEDKDEEETKKQNQEEDEDEINEQKFEEHEELIRQDFLMDSSKTAGEVLQETGINIESFVRFEVGEDCEDD